MKPCDCYDDFRAKKLNEQGISFNDCSIRIAPRNVILQNGPCELKIPMNRFYRFAKWYLEDQHVDYIKWHIETSWMTKDDENIDEEA